MTLGNANDPEQENRSEKMRTCHVSFYGWDEQEELLSSSLGAANRGRKQTEYSVKDTETFSALSKWPVLSQV